MDLTSVVTFDLNYVTKRSCQRFGHIVEKFATPVSTQHCTNILDLHCIIFSFVRLSDGPLLSQYEYC